MCYHIELKSMEMFWDHMRARTECSQVFAKRTYFSLLARNFGPSQSRSPWRPGGECWDRRRSLDLFHCASVLDAGVAAALILES